MYALPFMLFMRIHRYALNARRRDRTWKYLAWSAVSGVVAAMLIACLLFATTILFSLGLWWLALPLLALFIVPIAQGTLVRSIAVPLGWYRVAFWIGHFSSIDDSDAYGMVCAAWAHSREPTPAGEAWIAAIRDKRKPLGDAEVVATALIVSAHGDAVGARYLMRSVLDLVEVHPTVREIAGEWLACDAAERGDWRELAADAAAARFPATSLTYLLEGIAAARIGEGPSRATLYARWLFAPHRGVTKKWLTAPAITRESVDAVISPELSVDAQPLPRAVAAHLALANNPMGLGAAVSAWDAALSDATTRAWIIRRALELDAPHGSAERVLQQVGMAVTSELAGIADAAKIGAPPARGVVGDALARKLRHGRLDSLEQGFSRWEDRRHDSGTRASIDEWREWIALRHAYDDAVLAGGLDLRRLAFPHAYKMGNSMGAFLWNERNEYALSHAIFTWLCNEAMAVGDTEAIEMLTRNSRLAVSTRTGRVEFPKPT